MINTDNPKIWTFKPPKICDKNPVKLFALNRPYYGQRVNSTILQMPIKIPDFKHTKGLSAAKNIKIPEEMAGHPLLEKDTNNTVC